MELTNKLYPEASTLSLGVGMKVEFELSGLRVDWRGLCVQSDRLDVRLLSQRPQRFVLQPIIRRIHCQVQYIEYDLQTNIKHTMFKK